MTEQIRVFSSGGGLQSTAALALSAEGVIDFPVHLFCNVGEDSEHPDTLAYVRDVAIPYAKSHGIEFRELKKIFVKGDKAGQIDTIYSRIMTTKSQAIPGYLAGSGAPGVRTCTTDYKVRLIAKTTNAMGATAESPAIVGLGISIDEFQRMRTDSGIAWQRLNYPLIDLRLTRNDCRRIIADAGLPIPPKSACFFCPYQTLTRWRDLKEHRPDLFAKAVALEQRMLAIAAARHDAIYLTNKLIPLEQAVAGTQHELPFEDDPGCESGFCMT